MKVFFAIVFFYIAPPVAAQYPSLFFQNISINEGLSQNSVVDIAFDAKGFVWLATQDGLNRFDGHDFLIHPKKFDVITSGTFSQLGKLSKGTADDLWMLSKGGQLEKLNLVNNRIQKANIRGRQNAGFASLLLDGHNWLWLTSGDSLLGYDASKGEIKKKFIVPGYKNMPINELFKDQNGTLWLMGSQLWKLQSDKIEIEPVVTKNKKAAAPYNCTAEDKSGNLWIGTLGSGLFVKNNHGAVQQFVGYSEQFPPDLVIEDILVDNDGRIWIGTYGKGLFIIDPVKKTVEQFTNDKRNPFSIPYNDVLSIKQDAAGGIWLGTDGGGVSYYNKDRNYFILFNNQTLPQNIDIASVRSITTDNKGNTWAGTSNNGLTFIDAQKKVFKNWRFSSFKKNISNPDRIVSLLADGEMVWAGTQGNGLMLFDTRTEKVARWFYPGARAGQHFPDATAWCLYKSSADEVWVGTEKSGLCLFKAGIFIAAYNPASADGAGQDAVRCIEKLSDTTLCIGFAKGGLLYFNTSSKAFSHLASGDLQNFMQRNSAGIKTILYTKPLLWIGTDGGGLIVVNVANNKYKTITEVDGLPNNTVYGILSDSEGNLWASTNKGLSRFSTDIWQKGAQSAAFTNYTVAQGLQSNEFNTGAYHKAADGTLWFGGIGGLNAFKTSNLNRGSANIPVVFTKILVDNEPLRPDTSAAYKKVVHLSHKARSVAFTFAALYFSAAQQHRYYYKLQGYDSGWIDAGQRAYAAYTNIPEGNYSFAVKYVQPGDSDERAVTQMQVLIAGPFWKKGWFLAAIALAITAAGYAFYKYRIAQVMQLLKVRQNIATDLHDDIGSTLTNINILSELSKKSLHNQQQAQAFLERISEEVQISSQSLDDIIWSVNTQNDTWAETFSRMRRYAAELFEKNSTLHHINLDEGSAATKLAMDKRRDVFLIYKEILTNISKHAAATEVWINIALKDGALAMEIKDNGKGFNAALPTHRNGLKNLNIRVTRWGGSLALNTSEKGTAIKIIL